MHQRDRRSISDALLKYLAAVLSVLIALVIIKTYGEHRVGSSLFYAAVMIAAWFGGLGPGLVASFMSAGATAYYFLEPPGSFLLGVDDVIRTIVFTAVAVLITSRRERPRFLRIVISSSSLGIEYNPACCCSWPARMSFFRD